MPGTGILLPTPATVTGIAAESSPGTVTAPTNSLRLLSVDPRLEQTYLYDQGMQQSSAGTYGSALGVNFGTVDVTQNLYPDEVGWWLASLLGNIHTTGASDPYTTTFAALNPEPAQPGTFTFTDSNALTAQTYSSCRCSHLSLSLTVPGLAQVTATLTGLTVGSATIPSLTASTTSAISSHSATITLNGLSAIANQMTWNLERTIVPISRFYPISPSSVFAGGDIRSSGSMTLLYPTDASAESVIGLYANGTKVPLQVTASTSASRSVQLRSSTVVIDSAFRVRTEDYVAVAVTFTSIANTTDAGSSGGKSPVFATTVSQISSY